MRPSFSGLDFDFFLLRSFFRLAFFLFCFILMVSESLDVVCVESRRKNKITIKSRSITCSVALNYVAL